MRAIETALPRPRVEVRVTIPFNRGDLVSRIHERGEVMSESYSPEGTVIHAMVDENIAQKIAALHGIGMVTG
jgi:GTP-binding protein HflX